MPSGVWLAVHSEALKAFVERGLSFTEVAKRMNAEFGTNYTRNACIGRAQRMGVAGKLKRGRKPKELVARERKLNSQIRNQRKKAERWAAKPWLAEREWLRREREESSKRVMATCKSKTSPTYRNHLPRAPEMSKTELRAMLASAIQNTAAMEPA